jgi:hypothetical protein
MGEALELQEDFNVSQKKVSDQITKDNESKKTNGAFISPINPYGGWNMENTATALGAFAQDKNALGVVGASGKLLLSGARNALSGAGAYKILKEASEEKERDIIEEQNKARTSYQQKGGKVEKMMTGNFIQGNEESFNIIHKYRNILNNVKILKEEFDEENNEYIITYE